MDADGSLGTLPPYRSRTYAAADTETELTFGRPVPSVRRPTSATDRADASTARRSNPEASNLTASFPLFFFGAGCIAAAAFVLLEGSGAAIGRIPLWVPFVALGIIALAGGTLSVFAEPDEVEPDEPAEETPRKAAPPVVRSRPPEQPRRSSTPSSPARDLASPRATPEALRRPSRDWAPTAEEASSTGSSETESVAPDLMARDAMVPDDVPSLLKELDSIEADLRASRIVTYPSPAAAPVSPAPATGAGKPVAASVRVPVSTRAVAPTPSYVESDLLESEAPRQVAHCVGCGSVILHSGTPSQCQVCGEPLCSDCRDRSLAEGKPNLCPLCGLLDTVHAKGPTNSRRSRTRT